MLFESPRISTLEEQLRNEVDRRHRAETLTSCAEQNLRSLKASKRVTDHLVEVLRQQIEEQKTEIEALRKRNKDFFYDARRFRADAQASELWTRLLEERVAAFEETPKKGKDEKQHVGRIGRFGAFLRTTLSRRSLRRRRTTKGSGSGASVVF
ncbi:hypothetical protein QR680_009472 [Steinernema hermaphroditum]|uniref:Uncharacterized protein n=1 Tax=Steinernema hermaphroditum TaxID=289476 RepID=A0AA39IKD9_9BILA|nr:hypothetical protein QR680_009472 [Steinernema hermaphroditum]